MSKRNLIILALLVIALAALTALTVFIPQEQTPTPEEYIAANYFEYEVVKTAEVGKAQAFLLKNNEKDGMILARFYDGRFLGALGKPQYLLTGIDNTENHFSDGDGALIIVAGENVDMQHTDYYLALKDYSTYNTDNPKHSVIQRDISDQQYVLDIYFLPDYYTTDFANNHFENGEHF